MKTLYSRLIIAYAILLSTLLTGLGIVLGQFFPMFDKNVRYAVQATILVIILIVVLVIAFILSLYMATRLLSLYAKPIDEVTAERQIKLHKGIFFCGHRFPNLPLG